MNRGLSRMSRLWRHFTQTHKEYRALQKQFEARMREQRRSEALAAGGTRAWFERLPAPLHFLTGVSIFLSCYSILWTAAHFLLRAAGRLVTIPGTLREYLTLIFTFFLFGLSVVAIRYLFRPEARAMQLVNTLTDAMSRMGKGDFNVNLEVNPRYAGQYYEIVKNFKQMAADLGQIEDMRQQFVANVSHEIQSPLTSIKGFAQALKSDRLSETQRKHYLDIIEAESERLSRLSDNLLKLTTLESKRPPYQPRLYRLDKQLRQVVLAGEPQWQSKRLELDIRLAECELEADEELLRQVWVNLLHNAIKFTPEGGTLGISLSVTGDSVAVHVEDTGPGVPAEHLPRLFERFYKADKSRNRAAGGSGLGLSIVQKIVHMHHGEVSIANRLVAGTRVTVELPLTQSGSHS
ncbi:sensor histidine kinase [Cohnella hashimotonis]|uniref:histidine kinase n=1 Tax=Cohnella hashimotonis TaxID=2826895 RepID=A0ABT6THD9_9BACL|nr:HAMP domain-containing sensor histidine kinase [Cohnella hashimotonis]MDI4645730.1 HAMP domain-containing sensor histidine kinase [Cohnella hashimotonis]